MEEVRVRFAPSPTGFVHIGSLRTALYNFLFAKHHKGKIILRIEDTDQNRFVEGSYENLLQTMEWAGMKFDEGPQYGGPHAPYFQSKRLPIYQKAIAELLAKGRAYHCFCDSQRLENMRQQQIKAKMPVKYDGLCKNLSSEEVEEKVEQQLPFVVRMKIESSGFVVVNDLIRGEIKFNKETIDEQILLKSDGFPTYHLANVVDDHQMRISHVIRGEEWLPSTPKHVLLYQAFAWELPAFAHLPLLLNPDRSKLSKRQGDVAVEDYRKKGYLTAAFLNFVALLGWHTPDNREIFSIEELIDVFSLERVNKSGAVFEVQKLDWLNSQYLKKMAPIAILNIISPQLSELGILLKHPRFKFKAFNENKSGIFKDWEKLAVEELNYLKDLLKLVINEATFLSDIAKLMQEFCSDKDFSIPEELRENLIDETAKRVFSTFLSLLQGEEKEPGFEKIKEIIKKTGKMANAKGKALFHNLRIGLTGRAKGYDLASSLHLLGKEELEKRIRTVLNIK
ncbi:glutamate--tRNA ligase [Candidatus Riflebacteria bacterium]